MKAILDLYLEFPRGFNPSDVLELQDLMGYNAKTVDEMALFKSDLENGVIAKTNFLYGVKGRNYYLIVHCVVDDSELDHYLRNLCRWSSSIGRVGSFQRYGESHRTSIGFGNKSYYFGD